VLYTYILYKSGRRFSLFSSYFRALLRVNDDEDPGCRVYAFRRKRPRRDRYPDFRKMTHFFVVVQYCFPPIRKQRTYAVIAIVAPPGQSVFFFIFALYPHSVFYDFIVRRRGTKTQKRRKPPRTKTHENIIADRPGGSKI